MSSRGEHILFADADGATTFEDYSKMEAAMEACLLEVGWLVGLLHLVFRLGVGLGLDRSEEVDEVYCINPLGIRRLC